MLYTKFWNYLTLGANCNSGTSWKLKCFIGRIQSYTWYNLTSKLKVREAPPPLYFGQLQGTFTHKSQHFQNATKHLITSFCWPLKMYKAFENCFFFQHAPNPPLPFGHFSPIKIIYMKFNNIKTLKRSKSFGKAFTPPPFLHFAQR